MMLMVVCLCLSGPQVQASDADDGANKQIEFRLASGNDNNTFHIHPSSGLITTRNPVVDREGIPLYRLVVEAIDQVRQPSARNHTIQSRDERMETHICLFNFVKICTGMGETGGKKRKGRIQKVLTDQDFPRQNDSRVCRGSRVTSNLRRVMPLVS